MLKNILTGGIDLPKLEQRVLALCVAVTDNREETNTALADHIKKVNFRFDDMGRFALTRASTDDLEMLKQRVERLAWELEDEASFTVVGKMSIASKVEALNINVAEAIDRAAGASVVANTNTSAITNLEASVATLTKQVEALTATKLGEVKARKAVAKK